MHARMHARTHAQMHAHTNTLALEQPNKNQTRQWCEKGRIDGAVVMWCHVSLPQPGRHARNARTAGSQHHQHSPLLHHRCFPWRRCHHHHHHRCSRVQPHQRHIYHHHGNIVNGVDGRHWHSGKPNPGTTDGQPGGFQQYDVTANGHDGWGTDCKFDFRLVFDRVGGLVKQVCPAIWCHN